MRLLHHRDAPRAADEAASTDPVADAVWRTGLAGASPSGALVIHAPHASELVEAAATPTAA